MVNRDTIEMIIKVADKSEFAIAKHPSVVDISSIKNNYKQMRIDVNNIECDSMAVWGASHQAFTLAATTNLKDKIKYIIDSADFKQGKYSPASHIKIVDPDHFFSDPVDQILIVAPGYTDEIAKIICEKFGNKVQIKVLKEQRIVDY